MIAKLDKCVLSIYKGSQGFNIGRGRVTNKVTGGKRKQDVFKTIAIQMTVWRSQEDCEGWC